MEALIEQDDKLDEGNARQRSEEFISTISHYPGNYQGNGIVICAGGVEYLTNAWVCVSMLRHLGCTLPIQIWHRGPNEINDHVVAIFRPLGVEFVDAMVVSKLHPARILNGWEIKPFSILQSRFKKVLLLDADNVPVVNPEFLFETPQFQETGAIFWPDFGTLAPERKIWSLCGVHYRHEPEFESGQIVVDKQMCWQALNLTMWYNEHSDFYYRHIHGDKETYHMAFRKLDKTYAMPVRGICALPGVMCQHDFHGERIFQHRNLAKWKLHTRNRRIPCFLYETECLKSLEHLRTLWDGVMNGVHRFNRSEKGEIELKMAASLLTGSFDYNRIGHDCREMSFLPDGFIGIGADDCEIFWDIREYAGEIILEISSIGFVTCFLKRHSDKVWKGRWSRFERMRVELSPRISE